jgi:hypothetical protein
LEVTDWLHDERLSCPIPFESAYALRDETGNVVGESLPFTNVTHAFVGALDYVLFDTRHFLPTQRLYVPTSFKELNGRNLHNGHLLPSMDWPSDHLAVGVQLELISGNNEQTGHVVSAKESESVNSQVALTVSTSTDESAPPPPVDGVIEFCAPVNGGGPVPLPPAHHSQCACGCVPKILSLFEMAELRKQAKLKDNAT